MKIRATFEFDHPGECTFADLAEFITEALEAWGGQRHPDDSLFNSLGVEKLTLSKVPK